MNGEEVFAALMRKLPGWLERPIEDLVKMQAVGSVYLDTHRSILRRLKSGQIELAEEDRKSRLAEGQAIGEAILDVEARIGELLPSPEAAMGQSESKRGSRKGESRPKIMPDGISKHQRESARIIARHPEAVAQVKAEAKENEDIPTKTAVLNRVRLNAERKRRASTPPPSEIEITAEQMKYLNTLERIANLLPIEPPADWNEKAFQRAQAYARIIIKRLEVFEDARARIPE